MGLMSHVGQFDPPGHLVVKSGAKQEVTPISEAVCPRAKQSLFWDSGPFLRLMSLCHRNSAIEMIICFEIDLYKYKSEMHWHMKGLKPNKKLY